jgi:hypothetical protein
MTFLQIHDSNGADKMGASRTTSRVFALAGCIALTMAACSGQTDDTNNGNTSTPDSGNVTPPAGGDDAGSNPPLDDGSAPQADDAGKISKPKAIGSPCSVNSDCDPALTCNTTFPGGLCTKTCAASAECTGKQGSVGACINALCFAACAAPVDAGTVDADAGKPKSPCKNKAFSCQSVPGETQLICVPPTDDGGVDDASTEDGSVSVDAASE